MKAIVFALILLVAVAGCDNSNSTTQQQPPTLAPIDSNAVARVTPGEDSADVLTLLKNMYRWHASHQDSLRDFEVVVEEDTLQTKLDWPSYQKTFRALQQTGYFSTAFLANYQKLGERVDSMLVNAHPKYQNEINFSFQDADPWTWFQDDAEQFWNRWIIGNYRVKDGIISLQWTISDRPDEVEGYKVRFAKENDQWKVDYVEGFDLVHYQKLF